MAACLATATAKDHYVLRTFILRNFTPRFSDVLLSNGILETLSHSDYTLPIVLFWFS